MTLRLLLAALLLWGTTGAAVCRAYCAHGAEFAAVSDAQASEQLAPGAPPCHGQPSPTAPAPRSQPQDSDDPEHAGCCPDLWFTAGGETSWTATQAPAFSTQGTLLAMASTAGSNRRVLTAAVPPETLRSPFRSQNPPLLI